LSATPTSTENLIIIELQMPASHFASGDLCSLDLGMSYVGSPRPADLYVLLDIYGDFWSYPSWQHISLGLDYEEVDVPPGTSSLNLIPEFTLPPVPPAGPLYFYAAMFEPETLSLDTLVSNGAVFEFHLE
jgi:hypothetical protein